MTSKIIFRIHSSLPPSILSCYFMQTIPLPSAFFMITDSLARHDASGVNPNPLPLPSFLSFLSLQTSPLRPYPLTDSGKADSQRRPFADGVEEFGLAILADVMGDLQVAKGTWSTETENFLHDDITASYRSST